MKKPIAFLLSVLLSSFIWTTGNAGLDPQDSGLPNDSIQPAATTWVDIATGPVADPGNNTGLAWGDFDGDGDDDLYLAKDDSGQANVLLVSNGDGSFEVCDVLVLGDTGVSLGASWGDYNNDGYADLFLANLDGGNRVFRNEGPGGNCAVFTEVFAADLNLTGESVGFEWVDYDHDGKLEVYVSNRDGANQLLSSANGFMDLAPVDLQYPNASQGAAWCDYNQDLKPDLFLVTEGFEHHLYAQQSPAAFADQVLTTKISGQGCSWGDYDNDGDFDVFVTYWGQNDVLWDNLGNGQFAPVTAPWLGTHDKGQSAAWGDYDNDGFVDLFVANSFEPNVLYHNEGGTGEFSVVTDLEGPATDRSIGAAWSDVDLDGDLDLYICNHNAANQLLRNDQSSQGNWLQVQVRGLADGTQSNGMALGAVIKVEAGGLTLWRQVSGSSGYASQSSLVQHFGLGSETAVDQVTVTWPYVNPDGSHHETVILDPATNGRLLVVEPPYSVSSVPDGQVPQTYALGQCHPNPFNPQTSLPFTLTEAGRVDLRVYDVSGNLVKILVAGETRAAGEYTVVWHGRDQAGNKASAGVYFYQFLVDGRGETRSAVMVK